MSSPEDLTLNNLPRDVIRRTMRIILASNADDYDAARLISPRWNDLIVTISSKFFPSIPLFRWIDATSQNMQPKLFMRINAHHRKYFKVSKWLFCPVAGNIVEVDSGERFLMRQYLLGKIFKRCSHIETIQLSADWVNKNEEHEVLREALNGVYVEKVEISGISTDENYCDKILDLIGGAIVKRLALGTLLFDFHFDGNRFFWHNFQSRGAKPHFDDSCEVIRRLLAKVPSVELVSQQHLSTPAQVSRHTPDQRQIDDSRRSQCQQFVERLQNESPSTEATMIEEPNGAYGGITLRVDLKTKGFG